MYPRPSLSQAWQRFKKAFQYDMLVEKVYKLKFMPFNRKIVAVTLGTIAIAAVIAYRLVWWPFGLPTSPALQQPTAAQGDVPVTKSKGANEGETVLFPGWQIASNEGCGVSFSVPESWAVSGYLGESKIVSPEDKRLNDDWEQSHRVLLANEKGDAPLGPDVRSLYMSCQYGVKDYLGTFSLAKNYKDFADKSSLAAAIGSGTTFTADDANPALVRTMAVGGQMAYEIKYSVNVPGSGMITNYEFAVERGGKILEIQMGHNEYDSLSDTVKRIIGSIRIIQ
jgi:hypothetical protein